MADMSETNELLMVIEAIPQPELFLRKSFFKKEYLSESKTVTLDKVIESTKTLAPLVAPANDPQLLRSGGNASVEIVPAYSQYYHDIIPSKMQERRPGEALLGSLSPQERKDAEVLKLLKVHMLIKEYRLEYMASEILHKGICTLANETEQGAKSPTQILNFQRIPTLTPAPLTGNRLWWTGNAIGSTATPLQDIQDLLDLIHFESGASVDRIIFGKNAWTGLSKSPEYKDLLSYDKRLSSMTADLSPVVAKGALYRGSMASNNIEFWTYSESWENSLLPNVKTPFVDPDGILLIDSTSLEGCVLYGMVQDITCLQAVSLYTKEIFDANWQKNSRLFSQFAPVVFPGRINSTASLKVC